MDLECLLDSKLWKSENACARSRSFSCTVIENTSE
jgi:hypothetical protein